MFSQNSIVGNYPTGEIIKDYDVFLLNESGKFHVVNAENDTIKFLSCKWTINAINEENENIILQEFDSVDYIDFILDTSVISINLLKNLQRIIIDNDNSVYNKLVINLEGITSENEEVVCSKPVRINILPAIPQIKLKQFYKGNKEEGYETVSAYADFIISQERQKQGFIFLKEYDELSIITSVSYTANESYIDDFQYFFYFPLDNLWYSTLQVLSRNTFGDVYSEIYTIDNTIDQITTGINKYESEQIIIYPNPVSDSFSLSGSDFESVEILVIDVTGKTVMKFHYTSNKPVNVSNLNPGIYQLIINYKNHLKQISLKLIKN